MKKSTFVSFSSMMQQSVQSKEEQPVQSEPEVDYEKLYLDLLQEKEQLEGKLSQYKQNHEQDTLAWNKEKEELKKILSVCERQVLVWKDEMREHVYSVFMSFLQTLIQDPNFHQLAVHDMVSQAILELSDKKNVHVDVSPELLEKTKDLLSGRAGWTVSSNQDLKMGVRFSQESVFWKTELEPVFQSFFEILEDWVKEKE